MVHSSVSGMLTGISPLGSSPASEASPSHSDHEMGEYSQGEADTDDEDGLSYNDYQQHLAHGPGGTGFGTTGSFADGVLTADEMIPGYLEIRKLDPAAPTTPKKRATKPKIDRSSVEIDEEALEE